MEATSPLISISGRYTISQLEHLAGTMLWPKGVPETVPEREMEELQRLLAMAREYIEKTPNATAVDILENQILNVVSS